MLQLTQPANQVNRSTIQLTPWNLIINPWKMEEIRIVEFCQWIESGRHTELYYSSRSPVPINRHRLKVLQSSVTIASYGTFVENTHLSSRIIKIVRVAWPYMQDQFINLRQWITKNYGGPDLFVKERCIPLSWSCLMQYIDSLCDRLSDKSHHAYGQQRESCGLEAAVMSSPLQIAEAGC